MQRRTFLAGMIGAAVAGCSSGKIAGPDASTTTSTSAASSSSTATVAATVAATTRDVTARFVSRGSDTAKQVALTFHMDGDTALAQRLLDTVKGRARITCFVIGSWLDANPSFAAKILEAGHEVANHTYTHPTFAGLAPAQMATEITRCRDTLVRLAGTPGKFFRPSGTDDGLAVPSAAIMTEAGKAGYEYVLGWDVEPFDYQDPGRDAVRQRVAAGLKAGSIVSLHFGHTGTVDALAGILDDLDKRQLSAVTASALLGVR